MAELTRRPRYPARVLGTLNGQSEGAPLSVHEIAARFKVRRETIYHDLRILAEAGYPVTGDEAGRSSATCSMVDVSRSHTSVIVAAAR